MPSKKSHSTAKYCFFRYFSKYCLSGFAILVALSLKQLGLGAEFNSASDETNLEGGCRPKRGTCGPNTAFFGNFSRYCQSGFAIIVGLSLKQLGLGAEFNSASDGTNLEGGCRAKTAILQPNTVFSGTFQSTACPDSL